MTKLELDLDGNPGEPIIGTGLYISTDVGPATTYSRQVGTVVSRDRRRLTVEVDTATPDGRALADLIRHGGTITARRRDRHGGLVINVPGPIPPARPGQPPPLPPRPRTILDTNRRQW